MKIKKGSVHANCDTCVADETAASIPAFSIAVAAEDLDRA